MKQPMSIVEILKAAKAKIADPAHWTTGILAKSAKNRPVKTRSRHAIKWCSLGAVYAVAEDNESTDQALQHLGRVAKERWDGYSVVLVNDIKGHEAVMEMFDAAIKAAEEEGDNQ